MHPADTSFPARGHSRPGGSALSSAGRAPPASRHSSPSRRPSWRLFADSCLVSAQVGLTEINMRLKSCQMSNLV